MNLREFTGQKRSRTLQEIEDARASSRERVGPCKGVMNPDLLTEGSGMGNSPSGSTPDARFYLPEPPPKPDGQWKFCYPCWRWIPFEDWFDHMKLEKRRRGEDCYEKIQESRKRAKKKLKKLAKLPQEQRPLAQPEEPEFKIKCIVPMGRPSAAHGGMEDY